MIAACLATVAYLSVPPPKDVAAGSSSQRTKRQRVSKESDGSYGPATKLADLRNPVVKESSGLVASRTTPGLYWTNNDSGDGPFIYAFDEGGSSRGVWRVAGASARDWEDLAVGPGPKHNRPYLYIGDIGDNSGRRSEIVIYRVAEPTIRASDANSSKSNPEVTEPAERIALTYPDGKHNAEALLVHPVTGNIYLITKTPFAHPAVYEAPAPLNTKGLTTLTRLGELKVPSLLGGIITGGAISPDGKRVALCDYLQGYELVLPGEKESFNTIWKRPMKSIDLGQRKQGEAITYRLDGKALLMTSEGLPTPLIQTVRK